MIIGEYPPIAPGTAVRTTQADESRRDEWTDEGWEARKWGVQGEVLRHHDSHGICYDVRHEDGTEGCYSPSEIEVVETGGLQEAPESYLDQRRPPLRKALELEGDIPLSGAVERLVRKGYYTPPPRPWKVGVKDRGLGRRDFALLDKFGDLIAEIPSHATAEFIVEVVNAYGK